MDELGSNAPVVAVQRFGAGRTALFAGQASWRWKMLRPSTDGSYERFWRQTARWLTADALDPITVTPPGSVLPGDPVDLPVVVRTPDYPPSPQDELRVRVEAPDGQGRHRPVAHRSGAGAVHGASARGRTRHLPGRGRAYDQPAGLGAHRAAVARRRARSRAGRSAPQRRRPETAGRGLRRTVWHRRGGSRAWPAGPAAAVARRPPEWRDAWHTGWMFLSIVLLVSPSGPCVAGGGCDDRLRASCACSVALSGHRRLGRRTDSRWW